MSYIRRFTQCILVRLGLWPNMRAFLTAVLGRDEPELKLLKYLVPQDRIAIDVGANSGVYTHYLLGITPKIVAVEPNPKNVKELRRLFGSRIRIIDAALSDTEGSTDLYIPIGADIGDCLATVDGRNPVTRANCLRIEVPLKKLDSLGLDNVGFIKIDVEGHEEKVIRGGEELIRRCRPTLLIEAANRHRPDAVGSTVALMRQLGYSGFFLNGGTLTPVSEFDPEKHQSEVVSQGPSANQRPVGKNCYNFVFLHTSPDVISQELTYSEDHNSLAASVAQENGRRKRS